MKKHSILFLTFLASILLFTSCGQVAKNIAKDTLSGDYQGTMSFEFKMSILNLGLQDVTQQQKCFVKVFSTPESPSLVYSILKPDGGFYKPVNVKIAAIQLNTNGASFNIPQQQINDENSSYFVEGVSMFADADGNKVDGAVDDQSNFAFTYSGNLPIPIRGQTYEIPCVITCNAKKIDIKASLN